MEELFRLLNNAGIRYCVVGGQAVNHYVEPLVSLDLDLVVATEQLDGVESLLEESFPIRRFPHLNVILPESDLRVWIQTDPRHGEFVNRAEPVEVLGVRMPVASLSDVLQGKVWAAQDPGRRASKRQKDLVDIARLIEAYPELGASVPEEILRRIEE